MKWEKGKIIWVVSFTTYLVLKNGIITHVHKDMLRNAPEKSTEIISEEENILPTVQPPRVQQQNTQQYELREKSEEALGDQTISLERTQNEMTTPPLNDSTNHQPLI